MKHLMLVVNLHSGRGISKTALGGVLRELCKAGYAVTVFTPGELSLKELTAEYAAGYDTVVCAGGDGTFSDVVSGLMSIDCPPPIGYIPTGTANDVATSLALSRDPETAARAIVSGIPVPMDVGSSGNGHFVYIAAFGAFTGVSYKTSQSAKNALGQLAYVMGGISVMSKIESRHCRVEFDDGEVEGEYVFGAVTNSTSVAGLVRLPKRLVDLGDGKFEVILVKKPVNFQDLNDIIVNIITRDYSSDVVSILHTARVRFTFETPVAWTRDGEDGGEHSVIEITNKKQAIRVILDSDEI